MNKQRGDSNCDWDVLFLRKNNVTTNFLFFLIGLFQIMNCFKQRQVLDYFDKFPQDQFIL